MVSLVKAIIIVFSLSPFFCPNFADIITPFIYSVLCSKVSFVRDNSLSFYFYPLFCASFSLFLPFFLSFFLSFFLLVTNSFTVY